MTIYPKGKVQLWFSVALPQGMSMHIRATRDGRYVHRVFYFYHWFVEIVAKVAGAPVDKSVVRHKCSYFRNSTTIYFDWIYFQNLRSNSFIRCMDNIQSVCTHLWSTFHSSPWNSFAISFVERKWNWFNDIPRCSSCASLGQILPVEMFSIESSQGDELDKLFCVQVDRIFLPLAVMSLLLFRWAEASIVHTRIFYGCALWSYFSVKSNQTMSF